MEDYEDNRADYTMVVTLNVIDFNASKDIVGEDRLPETEIFDVWAGDIFTYTIEFTNTLDEEAYFTVSDTLDMALTYLGGDFSVTPSGDLEYTSQEPLNSGETISLSFEVEVQDVEVGWIFENIAWITAFTDPLDIVGTTLAIVEVISPQGRVIPEPGTLLLLGIGLGGITLLLRRKRG